MILLVSLPSGRDAVMWAPFNCTLLICLAWLRVSVHRDLLLTAEIRFQSLYYFELTSGMDVRRVPMCAYVDEGAVMCLWRKAWVSLIELGLQEAGNTLNVHTIAVTPYLLEMSSICQEALRSSMSGGVAATPPPQLPIALLTARTNDAAYKPQMLIMHFMSSLVTS